MTEPGSPSCASLLSMQHHHRLLVVSRAEGTGPRAQRQPEKTHKRTCCILSCPVRPASVLPSQGRRCRWLMLMGHEIGAFSALGGSMRATQAVHACNAVSNALKVLEL